MCFFVKDLFGLPFSFFLLPLMSIEDEGKLYGKCNFLQVDVKTVRPGFS